jgi:membrane protein implicated in regulation of membrane protease activity
MWIAFGVGGLAGAILTAALLDPALIVMSSLTGATAISQNIPLDSSASTLLFVVLLVLGITVQTRQYLRETKPQQSQRN